jgi:P27 family predicted phage terminase small subunit
MGRNKLPTEVHKANGNPSKKTFSDNEVSPEQFKVDELAPPAGLSARAKKVWIEIVEHLHRCGLYTVADKNTLIKYCEAFGDWQHAQKMVNKFGPVVGRTADGTLVKFEGKTAATIESFPRINPWVKVCNDAFNKTIKLIGPLGLSPAARAGLTVVVPPRAPGEGEFDEFDDD